MSQICCWPFLVGNKDYNNYDIIFVVGCTCSLPTTLSNQLNEISEYYKKNSRVTDNDRIVKILTLAGESMKRYVAYPLAWHILDSY